MSSPKVEIEQLDFRLLDRACDCREFQCGIGYLDSWFKSKAKKRHSKQICRVTTAHFRGNLHPAGFYGLSLFSEPVRALDRSQRNIGWETASFPCIHIPYLAMHQTLQGFSVGELLLLHAMERAYNIAKVAGAYALTLLPREGVSGFYKKRGFRSYGEQGGMLLPMQSIIDLFEQSA